VDRPPQPEDPTTRREWLEGWVAEQGAKGRIKPHRFQVSWRTRLQLARARLKTQLTPGPKRFAERLTNLVLDRNLDTSEPAVEPEHRDDRVLYVASPWHVVPRALRYLGVSDEDTFVDFGCGKGRVVHQAAKHPFRRVIGVEVSPRLAEIARRNLAMGSHQHRCRDVEIVVADVTDFQVPDDLTIGYFFHPFGEKTLAPVLRGIIDSIDRHPRCVRLIFVRRDHAPLVLATGRFRLSKEQGNRLLDGDSSRVAIFESI
jgi:SAM-dependent methyltransferase